MERYAVTEELLAAGAPVAAHWIADRQSGPNLLRYGTEEQRAEILPRIAAGECFFVIGMSEPDSGSDLASIRTRAVRNADGDWVVNGAKVWTSNAHASHYAITLVRTVAGGPGEPARRPVAAAGRPVAAGHHGQPDPDPRRRPPLQRGRVRRRRRPRRHAAGRGGQRLAPGDRRAGLRAVGAGAVPVDLSTCRRVRSSSCRLAATRRRWRRSAGSRRGCWRCGSCRCGSRRRWTAGSCPTSRPRWSRTWGRRSRPT